MKRIISLAIICLAFVQVIAQNLPQGIAYQAVAIKDGSYSIAGQNPQAIYWSNKDINVRFTIFEKYPGGSSQYSESHSTKTDDYGVFNLIIGQGNPISGDFSKVPWDLGSAHLQVEIDFDNNGTYKLTSLERFWSVPYAFVTRKSNSTSIDSAINSLNSKINYLKNRDKDTVIGNEGGVSYKSLDSLNKVLVAKLTSLKSSDKDTVIGNEWQKLSRKNDTLILSDGGGTIILLDEDPKNELQKMTLTNDTLILSNNGGSIALGGVLSKYGNIPSSSSATNNTSTNSLCFNGVLVNLESWGATNGYNNITPHGAIADSIFIFTAFNSTSGAVFLHDIKKNKITPIQKTVAYRVCVGDSIVYLVQDNSSYTTIVKKLNINGTLDSISSFSNGPGYQILSRPLINRSRDLIWITSSNGTQGDILKFQLSSKIINTINNPQNGMAYGVLKIVSGDTFIVGTRLVNTKTMTQINDFTFLKNSFDQQVDILNGKIYYGAKSSCSSCWGGLMRVYNISTQSDVPLGYYTGLTFLGKNNGELWFSITPDGGSSSYSKIGNLGLNSKIPSICTILPNGTMVNHGLGDELTIQALFQDNYRSILGGYYQTNSWAYYHCVNGTMPLYTLGYFYSR
jgi:hypothetical protein